MTTPTDATSTYDVNGNREDLSDVIYDISPMDTPFMSGIAHNSASATNHEWQTDALATAANNAVIEGEDSTNDALIATARLGNQTQISDKVVQVTRTQRQVNSAGRADEFDYQIMKSAKELKRDMEVALLANKAKAVGSESVARELAGVPAWINTNTVFGAGGADPTGDGTDARTDGTQVVLSEANVKAVIAGCWDEGGDPDTIMVGSFNKQAFSAFVGGGTSGPAQRVVNGTRIETAIDIYVSDFGSLAVIPNRFMRARDCLILEMDMWAMSSLTEFEESELAKNGDSDRKLLVSEYTLEARNEAASGGVFDITTA